MKALELTMHAGPDTGWVAVAPEVGIVRLILPTAERNAVLSVMWSKVKGPEKLVSSIFHTIEQGKAFSVDCQRKALYFRAHLEPDTTAPKEPEPMPTLRDQPGDAVA